MKSQGWLLSVSFLLVCGTIGCGKSEPVVGKPKPVVDEPKKAVQEPDTVVDEPKPVVDEPKTALEEPDTVVDEPKPVVEEEPGPSGEITNGIDMKLELIPVGEFMMGSPDSDEAADDDEKPQHLVRITKPFYLGVYPVTQEQYEKVMGKNPSQFKDPANPVESVSWDDAVEFCKKLSAKEGKTYRLPTEAEWEYACRAGTPTSYSFGDDEASLGEYAWFRGNAERKTHPVGQKKPNAWGLFDMHGNVWEWCQDCFGEYTADVATDPVGPSESTYRVYRGGSWNYTAEGCRSAYRGWSTPVFRLNYLGFRVAAVPDQASTSK
jgi:formylglycine-generating enzyme required for sulfatase activity